MFARMNKKAGKEKVLYESCDENETSPPIIRFGKPAEEELTEIEVELMEKEPEEIEVEPEEEELEEVELQAESKEEEPEEVEPEPEEEEPEELEVELEEEEPEELEVEPEEEEPEELEVELEEEEPEEVELQVESKEEEPEEIEPEPEEEEPEELEVEPEEEEPEELEVEPEEEEPEVYVEPKVEELEEIKVEVELEVEVEFDPEEVELEFEFEEDFLNEIHEIVIAERIRVMGLLKKDPRKYLNLKSEAVYELASGTNATEQQRQNPSKCVAPNNEVIYPSRKGMLSTDQERRARQLTSKVQAGNSAFLKVITASSLTSKCGLSIPRKFSADQLPKETRNVVLCRPDKEMTRPVKYYYRKNCQTFEGNPWRKFVLGNNLQEGDICMFEMVKSAQKITFVVHISRAISSYGVSC